MKVEILEKRLKAKDRETGEHYNLEEGDRVTVSQSCGEKWCSLGWAKDLAGECETGERRVVRATIEPHGTKQGQKASKAGG